MFFLDLVKKMMENFILILMHLHIYHQNRIYIDKIAYCQNL